MPGKICLADFFFPDVCFLFSQGAGSPRSRSGTLVIRLSQPRPKLLCRWNEIDQPAPEVPSASGKRLLGPEKRLEASKISCPGEEGKRQSTRFSSRESSPPVLARNEPSGRNGVFSDTTAAFSRFHSPAARRFTSFM